MTQQLPILPFKTGLDLYDEPEVSPDDAGSELLDMIPFRNTMIKRDGVRSIIQPIAISIDDITQANPGVVTTVDPHNFALGDQVLISGVGGMTEINDPVIQPFTITVTGASTFELNYDTSGFSAYTSGGVVSLTAFLGPVGISAISNTNPAVVTTFFPHTLSPGQTVFIQNVLGVPGINSLINFYTVGTVIDPTNFEINFDATGSAYISGGTLLQPIQGLPTRLTPGFFQDLIAFTQSQAYLFAAGAGQFINISGTTTWTGTDSRFFWGMNYVGSFWATNNFDPIRYYISGTTWTDFRPFLNGISHTELLGTIGATLTSFGPTPVSQPPVIPGSVTVIVQAGATEPQVTLTDDGAGILTSTTAGYSGTIDYATGEIELTVIADADPRDVTVTYDEVDLQLERALMIFSYKDRMIALNTTEGATLAEFPQRCRYSQNGTPYVTAPVPATQVFTPEAWRQDIPGRGGFIDAPTSERIVSAGFVRDVLVVAFEFSIWRLRYTGNEIIPFTWERIKSTQGAESTYSVVEFDEGIITIGRTGILMSDTNSAQRIDMIIPDQVLQITNVNNAQRRVQGVRDYVRQFAYWAYPEGDNEHFPNRVLTYNYIENCWGIYRQSFTAFGHFQADDDLLWQTATWPWQDETSPWNSGDLGAGFPIVVAGNQFGQVFQVQKDFTSDDGVAFSFAWLTKKFNPFFAQGLQCKAVYMYLLVAGTTSGEFTIEHFIDQDLNTPIATYPVVTAGGGQEKVWRRIPLSAAQGQYHQFRFTFSEEQLENPEIATQDIKIYQLIMEFAPGGRLSYGIGFA